ncbi:MAG: hypothetical protein U0324_37285 [Polyangiales bacterium]
MQVAVAPDLPVAVDARDEPNVPGAVAPSRCTTLDGDRSATLSQLGAPGNLSSLVWNGVDYAFTWVALESRSPGLFGLYFGRADREGALVPGSIHRVFAADRHQTRGALAVGDGGYGLAYLDLPPDGLTVGIRARFARLDAGGALIPGSDRALSEQHTPQLAIAIAYSPPLRQWAVAWQGHVPLGGGAVETHAYLTRVGASCDVLAPDAVLLDALRSTTEPYLAPSLVWARDRYAIALTEYVEIPNTRVSIAEVDPAAAAVTRRIVLREGGRPLRVALATDGAMYGAAWMQLGLDGPAANAVWFRRAAVGGDALGEAVALAPGRGSGEPGVLFDGDTFRVAYDVGGADGGVWRARISRDGTIVGTPGRRFAGAPPYSTFPLPASDGCNDAIGWTAVSGDAPQTASMRLHLRAAAAD